MNGRNGPGKLLKLLKAIAGIAQVVIDSYCATLFGYDPSDIIV